MIDNDVFAAYNLLVGIATGIGIVYFLWVKRTTVEYRPFLVAAVAGLLLFLVGGPIVELLVPPLVHWVHGVASLLVIFGLYDPLETELRSETWAQYLLKEPSQVRTPAEWMLPIDDAILDLFHSKELVLTPAIIAYNIDYSREEVNRRLGELEERGFVEKVERGKYRITSLGAQYVEGGAPAGLATQLRRLLRSGSN